MSWLQNELNKTVCDAPRPQKLDALGMQVQDLAGGLTGIRERLGQISGRLLGPRVSSSERQVAKESGQNAGKIEEISVQVGYLIGVSAEIHELLSGLEMV